MHINISLPASVLDEINIEVDKPVGHVRLHIEDDWLIIKTLASTIKFRPYAVNGTLVLQNIEVTGLLWPARSKIIKSLEDGVKKVNLPELAVSIKDRIIQVSFNLNVDAA